MCVNFLRPLMLHGGEFGGLGSLFFPSFCCSSLLTAIKHDELLLSAINCQSILLPRTPELVSLKGPIGRHQTETLGPSAQRTFCTPARQLSAICTDLTSVHGALVFKEN